MNDFLFFFWLLLVSRFSRWYYRLSCPLNLSSGWHCRVGKDCIDRAVWCPSANEGCVEQRFVVVNLRYPFLFPPALPCHSWLRAWFHQGFMNELSKYQWAIKYQNLILFAVLMQAGVVWFFGWEQRIKCLADYTRSWGGERADLQQCLLKEEFGSLIYVTILICLCVCIWCVPRQALKSLQSILLLRGPFLWSVPCILLK